MEFGHHLPVVLVTSTTVHTNTTHELYMFVFSFYYMFQSYILSFIR